MRCQVKIKLLTEFHETALVDTAWKLEGVGEGDERILLERFSSVTTVFQSLCEGSQEVCSSSPKRELLCFQVGVILFIVHDNSGEFRTQNCTRAVGRAKVPSKPPLALAVWIGHSTKIPTLALPLNMSSWKPSQVIADITKRMGAGMAEFVSKDLGQGTVSTAEYNKYCHYVAGLVGDGLTRLFAATGVEGQELLLAPELSNRCGFIALYVAVALPTSHKL